ncbi:unnamed protein product [Urochloa humidicola]
MVSGHGAASSVRSLPAAAGVGRCPATRWGRSHRQRYLRPKLLHSTAARFFLGGDLAACRGRKSCDAGARPLPSMAAEDQEPRTRQQQRTTLPDTLTD